MENQTKEENKVFRLEDLLSEEGLKVSGMGMTVKKLDALNQKVDRTNQLLSFIEKKLESLLDAKYEKI